MKNYFLTAVAALTTLSMSAAWDGTSQPWVNGDGSSTSPYLIETEQHLAYFQEEVTSGRTFQGEYVSLVNNLDMSADAGYKILPIGFFDEYVNADDPEGSLIDESKYFLGTFNGNFKVIDNIHIEYVATDFQAVGGTGLFACLSEGSVVKNVGLGSRSIITGGELTASLVGQMNGGTLQCCYSLATVNSSSTFGTGGIVAVGSNDAVIDRCYFAGTIAGNSDVGGIVGTAQYGVDITNCYNAGHIESPNGWFVGGIVGSAYDTGTTIANCYNIGTIVAAESFLSKPEPIVGDAEYKVMLQNCYFLDNGTFEEASGIVKKSESDMKSETMITLLNGGQESQPWQLDTKNLNNGYPVFAWQNDPSAGVAHRELSTLTIGVSAGTIFVNNNQGEVVRVYDITGSLVYEGQSSTIDMAQRGVYIVTVGNKVAKVRL